MAAPLPQQPIETYSCRSVTFFEKITRAGQGTYGTVYKAKDKTTGEIVALKKLRMSNEKEGFPITSIREIKILKNINHTNIVRLKDVVVGSKPDSIFLVFEYCEHDLATLMDSMKRPFSESEVKCILLQLLRAVDHLHRFRITGFLWSGREFLFSAFILHRDLKLSNLLMLKGTLKLADFGLARSFGHPLSQYTPKVVTLWYRAPEILLGSSTYHSAADCWSIGCIFGELLKNEPLLPGKTDLEQLSLIFRLLGSPNNKIWPGYDALPLAGQQHLNYPYSEITTRFGDLSESGKSLLKGLLCYDPAKRMTAHEALEHPYFSEKPLPKQPEMMPTFPSTLNGGSGGSASASAAPAASSASLLLKRKLDVLDAAKLAKFPKL